MLSETLDQLERLQAQEKENQKEIANLRGEVKEVKGQLASVLSTLDQLVKLQTTIAASLLSQGAPLPKNTPHQQQEHHDTQDADIELGAAVRPAILAEGNRDEEGENEEVSVVSVSTPTTARRMETSDEEEIDVDDETPPAKKRKADDIAVSQQDPSAFERMRINMATQSAANTGLFDDFRTVKIVPFIRRLATNPPGLTDGRPNPLSIEWETKAKGGREKIKVRRALNMLMNDMCKSKEEYQLFAGKLAPLYGHEDSAAWNKRSAEIDVMAKTVADRARDWVNDNRMKNEAPIDHTDGLIFGPFVTRIDNMSTAHKVLWNKWSRKSRPTAEALAAAAAAVEG